MDMDPRARFESTLNDLCGWRVTGVDYWDVHNYGPEPTDWDYGSWHHAVMGVELSTDRGPVAVIWTATFYPYGVEVFAEPIAHHLALGEDGPQRIGPQDGPTSPWARYLGTPVRATASYWEQLGLGPSYRADGTKVGEANEVELPVAIRLDFDAGAVWFVAAIPQYPEVERVFWPGDEIMVVFTAEKMRAIGFTDETFVNPARMPEIAYREAEGG